ncbi:MAG: hypothetical protein WBV84_11560 [Nitrososphaeraceae archaeon]
MISDYLLYLQEKRNVKRESIKVQLAAILHFFRNNNDEYHLTTHHCQLDLPTDESMSAHGDDRSHIAWNSVRLRMGLRTLIMIQRNLAAR